MNDYTKVAGIIEYLAVHFRDQPSLERLAEVAGLSSHHFHRLFRRWAQTTPKNFVQHLTALEAGKLLRDGNPVLDTSLEVGLSGPGRLHDLCVKLEAASPGEIRSGGEGWTINAGFCETPFGEALIAYGPRGICKLSFVAGGKDREAHWQTLSALWSKARLHRDDKAVKDLADSVFLPQSHSKVTNPLKLFVKGTAFQMKVWRALIDIPEGDVTSYSQVAQTIGLPSACRAVGNAVGDNPLAFIIPCHRVIMATGAIGNYRWGSDRKKAILAWERSMNDIPKP